MIKSKILSLMLVICFILSFSIIRAKTNELPLLGKVIYIDPGHGGKDPGAVYKDIYESNINLSISKKIYEDLISKGAIVYLTRDGDYDLAVTNAINRKRSDLSRRANIINKSMCDLYISIHLNAENSSVWKGAQVFYDDVNPKNEQIAKIMQEELAKDFKTDRTYKKTNEMYLHKRVTRPGVLIEVGFITNPNERYLLTKDDYQQRLSNTITNGIISYFES